MGTSALANPSTARSSASAHPGIAAYARAGAGWKRGGAYGGVGEGDVDDEVVQRMEAYLAHRHKGPAARSPVVADSLPD